MTPFSMMDMAMVVWTKGDSILYPVRSTFRQRLDVVNLHKVLPSVGFKVMVHAIRDFAVAI